MGLRGYELSTNRRINHKASKNCEQNEIKGRKVKKCVQVSDIVRSYIQSGLVET